MKSATRYHEEWIDRWKGVLILFVVLGHVAGAGGKLAGGGWQLELRNLIYLFHMPAFFLLAGVCWRVKEGSFFEFAKSKAQRLLVPYFAFGLLSAVVYAIVSRNAMAGLHEIAHLFYGGGQFTCNSVLWFPACMFVVLVLMRGIVNKLTARNMLLSAMLLFGVYFLIRYNRLTGWPWGLDVASKYLFYFIVGVLLKKKMGSGVVPRLPFWIVFACMGGYALFCLYDFGSLRDTRPIGGFSLWMFRGILGAYLSALVAKSLPEKGFRWLDKIGVASMGIMFLHKFPLVFFQEHVLFVRDMFIGGVLRQLVGVVGVTCVATVLSYVGNRLLLRKTPWALGIVLK